MNTRITLLVSALIFGFAPHAWSQSSDEAHIELSRGPVAGSARVVGLGGAYASIGEGLAGMALNPATLGNRNHRMKRWWDWDAGAGISFLPLDDTDYENDGQANTDVESQQIWQVGTMLQAGHLGFGWQWASRVYKVDRLGSHQAEFNFDEHLLGVGYQLERIGLALGLSGIIESTRIDLQERGNFFDTTEATAKLGGTFNGGFSGFQIGAIYRPIHEPYRLGMALRMTSEQTPLDEIDAEAFAERNVAVPNTVRSPTELRIGASWQFGKPYNPARRFQSLGDLVAGRPAPGQEPAQREPEAAEEERQPAPSETESPAEPAPPEGEPQDEPSPSADPPAAETPEPAENAVPAPGSPPEGATNGDGAGDDSESDPEDEEAPEEEEREGSPSTPEEGVEPAPAPQGEPKLLAPAPWLTARRLTPRHLQVPDASPTETDDDSRAPDFDQEASDDQMYALLALDLVVTPAQTLSGLTYKGPEGFAVDRDERAGTEWTAAIHAGAEFEPFPRWVKARLGTYYEPSRFEGVDGRAHVTGGFDVHFPHIWLVQRAVDRWSWDPRIVQWVDVPLMAQVTIDRAEHYLSIGVSVGVWN